MTSDPSPEPAAPQATAPDQAAPQATAPQPAAPEPTAPQSAPQPAARPKASGAGFWEELDRLGVRRDRRSGWLGGVCAGVAQRWGVDPLLVRALVVALTVVGGFGAVLYLAAWLLLPDADGRILLRAAAHGNGVGITLVVVLAILVLTGITAPDSTWFGGWSAPIVALLLFLVLRSSRNSTASSAAAGQRSPTTTVDPHAQFSAASSPESSSESASAPDPTEANDGRYAVPPPSGLTYPSATGPTYPPPGGAVYPPHGGAAYSPAPVAAYPPIPLRAPRPVRRRAPRGTGSVVLGLTVVAFGLGHLLDGPLQFPGSANLLGLLLALAVASCAALALGAWGRRGGLASVLTLLLLVPVAGHVAAHRVDLFRDESILWSPASATDAAELGAGTLTVDLAQLVANSSQAPTALSARVGTGEIVVEVPEGTALTIHAVIGVGAFSTGTLGETDVSGGAVSSQGEGRTDGFGINRTATVTRPSSTGAAPRPISLEANVGLGSITVQEK